MLLHRHDSHQTCEINRIALRQDRIDFVSWPRRLPMAPKTPPVHAPQPDALPPKLSHFQSRDIHVECWMYYAF